MTASPPLPRVAVLGLGPMGAPIARNLLAAGAETVVWNRSPGPAESAAAAGATIARDLADASSSVILCALPDIPVLRDLLDADVLTAWGAVDAVLVVLSTTSPDHVRTLAADLAPCGIRVVDAPMSGGTDGARAASLSLMVGGADDVVASVSPVLEAIGSTIVHVGALGTGSLAKLCNQIVVAGTLTSLAEAMALARAGGIDLESLTTLLSGGLAASRVLEYKSASLIARDYPLGGSATNQLKDLHYAAAAASAAHVPVRLVPVLRDIFSALEEFGLGDQDHAVVQELFLSPSPDHDAGTPAPHRPIPDQEP